MACWLALPSVRSRIFPAPPEEHPALAPLGEACLLGQVPCRRYAAGAHATPWLIVFAHPNAVDIDGCDWLAPWARALACDILAFEYPGYGALRAETPSPQGVDDNLVRVLHCLHTQWRLPPERVVLFGQSLGTGPVVRAAAHADAAHPYAAVVLLSAYGSLRRAVADVASRCSTSSARPTASACGSVCDGAARVCLPDVWPSETSIALVSPLTRLLILHGAKDSLFTSQHARDLYAKSRSKHKRLYIAADATHSQFRSQQDIVEPLAQLLARLYTTVAVAGGEAIKEKRSAQP
jgi:pimeloyl-ACP methyl ester carboxylesterase